jgi:hypothetical protein
MSAPTTVQLAEHLQAAPGSKERFGTSASAVLETARLVAAADSAWDKGTVSTFQDQEKIHAKVWGKLISIAGSANIASLASEDLPASYTALYALVVMTPNELEIAKQDGVIRSNASSRSILDWTKSFRLRGTGIEQEVPLTLVLMESLSTEDHQQLLDQLRNVAEQHHAELLEGKGGVRQSELKADQRRARAQQIEEELRFATTEIILDAAEDLKTRFSIYTSDDLIKGSLAQFTGFLQVIEEKVPWAFWRKYGRLYCLKVARDYNLTDSRAERYQLKGRIKSAKEKCVDEVPEFCYIADQIVQTYMVR